MALTKGYVALAQLVVGLELELGLVVVDAADVLLEGFELLGLADPQRTVENGHLGYGSNAVGGAVAQAAGSAGCAADALLAQAAGSAGCAADALYAACSWEPFWDSRRPRRLSRCFLTWRAR